MKEKTLLDICRRLLLLPTEQYEKICKELRKEAPHQGKSCVDFVNLLLYITDQKRTQNKGGK